ELVPRLEDVASGSGVQILGEGGSALEGFQGVQVVEEVGARGAAGAGAAGGAGKGVALGEEGGEQGGFARVASSVPFDEEAGEAGVDGEARHRAAQSGCSVIADGAELAEQEGGGVQDGWVGRFEPPGGGAVACSPTRELAQW